MKIGILGAGQLSQMLSLAAQSLGFEVHILAKANDEPATGTTAFVQIGNPEDPTTLHNFSQGLDFISFESEFYSHTELAKGLSKFQGEVFPSLSALALLQDRKTQKDFLVQNQIPTSEHLSVQTADELSRAFLHFKNRFVLKKRRGGYDGNGTFYAKSKKDLPRLMQILEKNSQGLIAEAFVPFDRELAVMAFRNQSGEVCFFPWVESQQVESRCDLVFGPIRHRSFQHFEKKMAKALQQINYVGALGIEVFQKDSELFVNELAPRVHNTGHFSQDALLWDQFALHLIAGTRKKFPKNLARAKFFAMANLIGQSKTPVQVMIPEYSKLHWYQKIENRPGRKMGHLNIFGANLTLIKKQIQKDQRSFKL